MLEVLVWSVSDPALELLDVCSPLVPVVLVLDVASGSVALELLDVCSPLVPVVLVLDVASPPVALELLDVASGPVSVALELLDVASGPDALELLDVASMPSSVSPSLSVDESMFGSPRSLAFRVHAPSISANVGMMLQIFDVIAILSAR
ncbi:hypothetical protein [Nannocystis punicea]|uniref:Uncharacterized protein n=1 Tax=Nannocystis punicea TaxID=2995304 RepID=A0ABY7GUK3_9BACT|nr:hypothetical protein [Nannocystis poenicansa]WAS90608.1 hypothetical protein O0S08_30850 [Nannocystis poenicansa]